MILKCPKCGGEDLEDTSVWCCACKQWVELETEVQVTRTAKYTAQEAINKLMAGWKGSLEDFRSAIEALKAEWRKLNGNVDNRKTRRLD